MRVESDPASMAALDFRSIHHMVEVPVREQQPVDLMLGKTGIGSLRSIEEQIARRGF